MASSLLAYFRSTPSPVNPPNFPYTAETNPYRAQRSWPPTFDHLSAKHQFRLERRYRRRTKLKWARPNWTKAVKLTQWGSIVFVVVYGVFYLDLDGKEGRGSTVFDGVRKWAGFEVGRESGRRGDGRERVGEGG